MHRYRSVEGDLLHRHHLHLDAVECKGRTFLVERRLLARGPRGDNAVEGGSLCELSVVRFVDATNVGPKVLQVVMASLFSAKADLLIARLVLLGTIHQVFKSDLFCIRSPFVRKESIFGNIVANEVLGQAELASSIAF
jgi:hypothetical protein